MKPRNMAQKNKYFAFISDKRKNLPTASCWSCSNEVFLRSSFCVPLVLLWFSYGTFSISQMSNGSLLTLSWQENVGAKKTTLKWIHSAFMDEPGGKAKREDGSKVNAVIGQ